MGARRPTVGVSPLFRSKPHCPHGGKLDLRLMGNVKTQLSYFGFALACGLLAGCASNNSLPPFHTVIHYDPSQAKTYVSAVPSANAPSMSDWKTNQIVGVNYGSPGPSTPTTSGQAVGGAASTPAGVSYGGAAGTTTTTSPTPTPGSGAPGTVIGNPPSTGIIGTYPTLAPTGPITTSPAATTPPSTGLNSPLSVPSSTPQFPALSTPTPTGPTNTSPGVIFTNRFIAPTNTGLNPGLNNPIP